MPLIHRGGWHRRKSTRDGAFRKCPAEEGSRAEAMTERAKTTSYRRNTNEGLQGVSLGVVVTEVIVKEKKKCTQARFSYVFLITFAIRPDMHGTALMARAIDAYFGHALLFVTVRATCGERRRASSCSPGAL